MNSLVDLQQIRENRDKKYDDDVVKNAMSDFKQQSMPAWRPVQTLCSTIITLGAFALVFIIFGAVVLGLSAQIIEMSVRYDDKCTTINANCIVSLTVANTITTPVYIYYELTNFYQNHRIVLQSRDNEQLGGKYKTIDEVSSSCSPVTKTSDIGFSDVATYTTIQNLVATPCGALAKAFFRDTYTIQDSTGTNIPIDETGLVWEKEKSFFKNVDNWANRQWTNMESEHFIVWMRVSGLPHFRKLWGKITNGLKAGTYQITINNRYDVSRWDTQKIIFFTTTNGLGGKHLELGILFVVFGGVALLGCIGFSVLYFIRRKNKVS